MQPPIPETLLETIGMESLTGDHLLKRNVALEIIATLFQDKGEAWIRDNLDTVRETITSVTGLL
ncbi:hypothetical protein [Desulfoplanes formicivorans]|uniref:Uncharacterized protein n=1 Tax=Desulfoplanes formicivorans TaxID=1592317 RepID=A0A194AKP8_9BACT|nr:hypothetical protein [Desulfoplanes formicivorans]GAU09815.1 hypothetical protein DPF_2549 [Desulfoplanes formicivorans]